MALMAMAGLLVAGCDKPPVRAAAKPAPVRRFRLTRPVSYAYLDLKRGIRPVDSLDQIPLSQRGAAIVHGGRSVTAGVGRFYVADLLDAKAGDSVQARLMTRREQFQVARAADLGAWQARIVHLYAGELANLDPHSQRRATSDRSREMLDAITPADVERKALEQQASP